MVDLEVRHFYFYLQTDKSQNYIAEDWILRVRNIDICIMYPHLLALQFLYII